MQNHNVDIAMVLMVLAVVANTAAVAMIVWELIRLW
jgi:hypothetical protein